MISGTCSMQTGHQYMQEPQVTQSQMESKPMVSTRLSASPCGAGFPFSREAIVGVTDEERHAAVVLDLLRR